MALCARGLRGVSNARFCSCWPPEPRASRGPGASSSGRQRVPRSRAPAGATDAVHTPWSGAGARPAPPLASPDLCAPGALFTASLGGHASLVLTQTSFSQRPPPPLATSSHCKPLDRRPERPQSLERDRCSCADPQAENEAQVRQRATRGPPRGGGGQGAAGEEVTSISFR